jgi:peptide deformylase
MILNILVFPNKILSQSAEPVQKVDAETVRLVENMFETMYWARGVGLAANQVGVLKRVIVVDCGPPDLPAPMTFINPVITHKEGVESEEEGCLSVPGYCASVKRAARIRVEALNRNGEAFEMEADGLLARCIQHEIDHLDGICFVDRLGALKKKMFRKKWARIRPCDMFVPEKAKESK